MCFNDGRKWRAESSHEERETLGAQASRLLFASEAMQTSVASKYAKDDATPSPRMRAAVHALAAGKDACAPRASRSQAHLLAVCACFFAASTIFSTSLSSFFAS